jgi:glycosyltransferase involved in cell wall biosynthesis
VIPSKTVLYTAAHSGFALERVPLGGGGTIASWLENEWTQTRRFPLRMLRPDLLGADAPQEKELIQYSEMAYARFCRRFERVTTDAILREDPRQTLVLCNDVSEGPDVRRLNEAGFPVFTIYHVDVVDYFCRIYLREWIRPETATALYDRWARGPLQGTIPNLLKLVFQKQADSMRYSRGLIVMSQAMKELAIRCNPGISPDKIQIFPWGLPESQPDLTDVSAARMALDEQFPVIPGAPVIVSLSRITPEKGQDRLLEALALWERQPDYPATGITYLLVGEAAYMQGKRFEARLRRLAKGLRRTRVHFVGYLSGARKRAILERSDLYVFPSRHESYGLTLLEAMRAGLPVLATPTYGARDIVTSKFGALLPDVPEREVPAVLQKSLAALLSDRKRLIQQGSAAQAFAKTQRFSATASRLADWLSHQAIK